MSMRPLIRQQGVAVITALLLTTLAITIVASLFWQQQVQVRSIENQRLQLQKQWILRGAIDYARVILTADNNRNTDNLDEPWAVPLAETRLDDYVENGRADTDVPDAVLSGGIEDAQGRLNLYKLCCKDGAQPRIEDVTAFGRLLTALQLSPSLAQAAATYVLAARKTSEGAATKTESPPRQTTATASQTADLVQVDDLLAVPGFTPEIVEKIRPFVIVINDAGDTKVNVNTASAEVLYATIGTLTLSEATTLVAMRRGNHFRSLSDPRLVSAVKEFSNLAARLDVKTNYFLVNGKVRLNRAGMEMQAMIYRKGGSQSEVIWIREF